MRSGFARTGSRNPAPAPPQREDKPPLPFRNGLSGSPSPGFDGFGPIEALGKGLKGLNEMRSQPGPRRERGKVRPGGGRGRLQGRGPRPSPRPLSCCCLKETPRGVFPLEFFFFFPTLLEGFIPPAAGPGAFLQPRPLRGKRESKNNRGLHPKPGRTRPCKVTPESLLAWAPSIAKGGASELQRLNGSPKEADGSPAGLSLLEVVCRANKASAAQTLSPRVPRPPSASAAAGPAKPQDPVAAGKQKPKSPPQRQILSLSAGKSPEKPGREGAGEP